MRAAMSKDADTYDNRFKILLTGDRYHCLLAPVPSRLAMASARAVPSCSSGHVLKTVLHPGAVQHRATQIQRDEATELCASTCVRAGGLGGQQRCMRVCAVPPPPDAARFASSHPAG